MSKSTPAMIMTSSASVDVESARLVTPAAQGNSHLGRTALMAVLCVTAVVAVGAAAANASPHAHHKAPMTKSSTGVDALVDFYDDWSAESGRAEMETCYDESSELSLAMGGQVMTATGLDEIENFHTMFAATFPGLDGKVEKARWYGDLSYAFKMRGDEQCEALGKKYKKAVNAQDIEAAYAMFDLGAKQCTGGMGCVTWAEDKALMLGMQEMGAKFKWKWDMMTAVDGGCGFMGSWEIKFPQKKKFVLPMGGWAAWADDAHTLVGDQSAVVDGLQKVIEYMGVAPKTKCEAAMGGWMTAVNANDFEGLFSLYGKGDLCTNGACMPMQDAMTFYRSIIDGATYGGAHGTAYPTARGDNNCHINWSFDYTPKNTGKTSTVQCDAVTVLDDNGIFTSADQVCLGMEDFVGAMTVDPCVEIAAQWEKDMMANDKEAVFTMWSKTAAGEACINGGPCANAGEVMTNFYNLFDGATYTNMKVDSVSIMNGKSECAMKWSVDWKDVNSDATGTLYSSGTDQFVDGKAVGFTGIFVGLDEWVAATSA